MGYGFSLIEAVQNYTLDFFLKFISVNIESNFDLHQTSLYKILTRPHNGLPALLLGLLSNAGIQNSNFGYTVFGAKIN